MSQEILQGKIMNIENDLIAILRDIISLDNVMFWEAWDETHPLNLVYCAAYTDENGNENYIEFNMTNESMFRLKVNVDWKEGVDSGHFEVSIDENSTPDVHSALKPVYVRAQKEAKENPYKEIYLRDYINELQEYLDER